MRKIILASGSPRRKELLGYVTKDFVVEVSDVDEIVNHDLSSQEIVKSLAKQKAMAVFNNNPEAIVLGSDTVVACDGKILGKPHSKKEAKEMMQMLRGKTHEVITGICFISKDEIYNVADTAVVYFNDISDKDIDEYIETAEPYDKAGGYAIQGWAGKYIRKIEGNYYTIMGLPVDMVFEYLNDKI